MILFVSCDNQLTEPELAPSLTPVEQFFSFNADSVGPALTLAIDTLRQRNLQTGFIDTFIKERGFPAWGSASFFYQGDLPVMLVPVSRPSKKKVSGIIFMTIYEQQPVYRWIPRDTNREGTKSLSRQQLEGFMLMFEKKLFGEVQTPGVKVQFKEKETATKDDQDRSYDVIIIGTNCGRVSTDSGSSWGAWQCDYHVYWTRAIDSGGGGGFGNSGGFGGNGGDIPGGGGPPTNVRERAEAELKALLEVNEFALLDGPCDEIGKYVALADFKPSDPAVINKLKDLKNFSSLIVGAFDIQKIKEAAGDVVNLDEFSVQVNELPHGMNAYEFLHHIRTHINNFIDTDYAEFSPYDEYTYDANYPFDDAVVWNSHDPLGAILHIGIPNNSAPLGDDGSVIVSNHTPSSWTFSTISAPFDWEHPVSGNRKFGFTKNNDGSYTFYTKGVDRITDWTNDFFFETKTFNDADALWKSFQQGIENYVNAHGGNASVNIPEFIRPDWNEFQKFFNGEVTLSSLGCD